MQCPSCGFANPEGMNFCGKCASPLSLRCPQCGFANPPGFAFCGKCATSLQTPDARPLDPRPTAGERRQLTVMFCDLVGSTPLSQQLDPEELREVMQAYQQACVAVIIRFEGHVAKYLGDGLLVYFGYPTAHEDDAQRAVRAGLEIVKAVPELSLLHQTRGLSPASPPLERHTQLPQLLQVRVGIHTGLVVAGEMGSGKYREQLAVVGETPNIAARLQEKALPNSVVISATTYRLVTGLFECQDLGPQTLKGLSTALVVYRVVRESEVQSRFEVAVRTGLTSLVGRELEVGLLRGRWAQAKGGEGQVVLLSGEAGIGKSRLVQALEESGAGEQYARLECRCSSYYRNSALYPVIELVQRVLQFKREDALEEKLSKLEEALRPYGFALPEVVPLFAALLSLPLLDRYTPLMLTPQKQKEQTQHAMLAWLLKAAERQPVRFEVEDLHWVDPSTLEFLGLLIDQVPAARMLVVLTFRPEFISPWTPRSHLTLLTLNRLTRKQAEVMVEYVTGGKALPTEVFQRIVAKTDGVPLFVEELTKMMLESGLLKEEDGRYELTGPLPSLAIPATLQDSLMARLDRLAPVREIAQVGATLGREFSYEVLQAVSPLDKATLQQGLRQLVETELLYQRGLPPQATYLFKHALIQDTAYQSLLKSKRQQYHQQIAQVLEERFPEARETQPELLAHHYTEAGRISQAIPYWQQAGQRAIQRSANVEAISHLTKGVELLRALPDTPERSQYELMLQITLGVPLMITQGYAALEVEKAYTRARELCQQLGETPQLFPVLRGLWTFYLVRAELQTAHELGKQLLRLAQSVQDPALLLEAHLALGNTLFFLGELAPAREHLEQGITLYDPQQHRSHAFLYGQDPGVDGLSYAALVLWLLGYSDQALKRSHEALALAHELAYPYSVAFALDFAAVFHHLRRDGQVAQERAEAAITLSTEQGFAQWVAHGIILRGWALAEQGQGKEIAQIRQGLAAWRTTGAELALPYYLALLAEAYEKAGQVEEALTVLAEALVEVHKNEGSFYEAELYRLKGQLTLKQSGVRSPESEVTNPQPLTPNPQAEAEAEACFLKAIEIARKQRAKSLELRAVMS
ncbi:MAG TPA: adenylate/guanylate cyclase domain-containing protein, partial [Candidatus Binatia bacterium]|nr:adenylate/guanylate cyclase domain-containing protein [Candidatus Binatia bacterium]